jgi:hypothetical protein
MQEITDTSNRRSPNGLAIASRQLIQTPFDGSQAPIDRGQPGRDRIHRRSCRLATIGRGVTPKHGVEVLGVPTKRQRERFERTGIAG